MPITLPPFVQYSGALVPIRGLWNATPPEGDKFLSLELDWPIGPANCVQVSAGNSPVPFTQIVALTVDNSRNPHNVSFIFPDTSFQLTVPGNSDGTYPVYTNAVTFYASSSNAAEGDITVVQIHNSNPPQLFIPNDISNVVAALNEVTADVNGNTPLLTLPSGVESGVIKSVVYSAAALTPTTGNCTLALQDNAGNLLLALLINAGQQPVSLPLNDMVFQNGGLRLNVSGTTFTGGSILVNCIYQVN